MTDTEYWALGISMALAFMVGAGLGGYLDWQTHRKHCACSHCALWRKREALATEEDR